MARVLKENFKKSIDIPGEILEFQARRDQLFFQLSLISVSKSGSWLTQNRQNSHWYRPRAVIYIGCEYNCTQWPTKSYMFIGKIFPSEQFPVAHNVMQCSEVLGLSQLWYKNKLWVLVWPPVLMWIHVGFSLLFQWEWQWLLPTLTLVTFWPQVRGQVWDFFNCKV